MCVPWRAGQCQLILLVILMFGATCSRQGRSTATDSEKFKQKIADYLTGLNPSVSQVRIDEIKPMPEAPFLSAWASYMTGTKPQKSELYVTEDGKYMILGQVWDLEVGPEVARWHRLSEIGRQNLEKIDLSDRPVKGNPDAEVVVIEYSDYQCPYCATAYSSLEKRLLAEYGDKIRFVFKHLPLTSIHPWAMKASIATACGFVQDTESFWGIHGQVFQNQKQITSDNLRDKVQVFAEEAGLNVEEFLRCFDNEETKSVIQSDMREAAQLRLTSTPTFLLNGAPFRGTPDYEEFTGFIELALKEDSGQ